MQDAIYYDLLYNEDSPTNHEEQEASTDIVEQLSAKFTNTAEMENHKGFAPWVAFRNTDHNGEEIMFEFNEAQSSANITAFYNDKTVIEFGNFSVSKLEQITQADLNAMFLILDMKTR